MIRDAVPADLLTITTLYNALIPTTTVTWTETCQSLDERVEWFATQRQRSLPVLVADIDDQVVGFTSYGTFRGGANWPGYQFTVEHTIHVAESHWGAGVGRCLLEALIERAKTVGVHVMVGGIDADN